MSSSSLFSILLVDDDDGHRVLIKRALSRSNVEHPVVEATSLTDARQILFGESSSSPLPQIIVLDLNLRDGRGTALLDELRRSPTHNNVAVVVLSTSSLESDIQESYRKGANRFVTKTADAGEFASEVAQTIRFLLSRPAS